MIIIADSGSTKITWFFYYSDRINVTWTTDGYNPVHNPPSTLESRISIFTDAIRSEVVEEVIFYGAGCSSDESKRTVKEVLNNAFPCETVIVDSDLIGAARALFGNKTGIASILGTGSSSCLIEGGENVRQVPSLGYLLGDEGSGFHLGSLLIKAYLKNELPNHLNQLFEEKYSIDRSTFLSEVYRQEKLNVYVASFTPFVIEQKKDPIIEQLIKNAFRIYFDEVILKYPGYKRMKLGFSGSVAYLLEDYLHAIAAEYDLKISKVIKDPIKDLFKYHVKFE